MKLRQINIINFGQLSNLTFALPSDQLTVFFGQNEAGKSTTVAFIKQILFGFYLRTSSSPFFEDYKPLAHVSPMGGSLIFEADNGDQYKLERLWAKGDKTKKGILTVFRNDQEVPANLFFDQIKKIDGNFYADSFIFNQEMLGQVAGLSQDDLLERIYYLGAAESGKLLSLRDDFEKEASKLFKKTGKKPEVNQLLKNVADQRSTLTEDGQEFAHYREINQQLLEKQSSLTEEEKRLASFQQKLNQVIKLSEQFSNYQHLQELEQKVRPLAFDADNYRKAQELSAQIKNLQETISSLKQQLVALHPVSEFNLTDAERLARKRSELLQWRGEYQGCQQKQQQLQMEQDQLLHLNPELNRIMQMSDSEILEMKTDFTKLNAQELTTGIDKNSQKLWLVAGGVLFVISLLQFMNNGLIGSIGCLLGLGIFAYGFWSQKNTQKQLAAKIAAQASKFNDFKARYHFDPKEIDLNSMLSGRKDYLLIQNKFEANKQVQNQISENISQLASQLTNLLQKPVEPDFAKLLFALDQLDELITKDHQYKEQKTRLDTGYQEQKQRLNELQLKLKAVLAKDKVDELDQYNERYQASLEQAKLQTQIETLKDNLNNNLDQLKKLQPEKILAEKQGFQAEIKEQEEKVASLRQEIAEIKVNLNNLADSSAVFMDKQQLANKETELINSSKEYLANLLAAKWIGRSLDLASNERFPKMLTAAKEYLKLLTGGRYVDLTLEKKLTVIRFDGKKREVKYLSRGTAEQLYFALKLAFIEQIKDQINLPILIDDSFVNFDDHRVAYIEKLLQKISQNNQVLIFTAQESLVNKLAIKPLTYRKETANA